MSKYSTKEKLTEKMEASIEQYLVEEGIIEPDEKLLDDNLSAEQIANLDPEIFQEIKISDDEAERTGYSNYSYWGSTVRMFFKNKIAVANLILMLVLVIFTFIQPYLPNQFDPNKVNYYNSKAVWFKVQDDGSYTMEGIKYTKGDLAVEPEKGETLAYIKVPDSWGVPQAMVCDEDGENFESVMLTKDSSNPHWYYCIVKQEKPHLQIDSESGDASTFHNAIWVTVIGEKYAVYASGVKQTTAEFPDDIPEGYGLVYLQAPENWGVPQLRAQSGNLAGADAEYLKLTPAEDEGWYYGFIPLEKNALSVMSEDGTVKGMNRATITSVLPQKVEPQTGFIENKRPSKVFWFGTNDIGQDLWARMWTGTRTSLFIGIVVAVIEAVIGIIAGLLWGYVRKLDFLFTELYNLINNIPTTIVLVLASYVMRPGLNTIIIAMSLTGWIGLARFIRNLVLIIRDRDFNLASRCLGTPTRRIITKNLLPQMISVIMLRMALAIPGAIGSEVFLSYIGLGIPMNIPSLGNLVNKGRTMMMAPTLRYQLFIPAIILSVITICFYLVGNAFSDAADPKNHN